MHGRQGIASWDVRLGVAIAAIAMVASPRVARAQDGFVFGAPRAAFTLRAGVSSPNGNDDLFDFTTQQLSLHRSDFTGTTVGGDLAVGSPGSRLAVVFGAQYASSTVGSDFRDYIGTDDLPISQTTRFARVPMTAGLKVSLVSPGRSIGSLAWIPTRIVPWIGGGAGATWYQFRQQGEFIDEQTLDVFTEDYESSGVGFTGYGAAGIDVSVKPRMAVTLDARYLYGKANVGKDFSGFGNIDLSGLTTTVGLTFRF